MVTKTLTITEDAYKLLLSNKMENESFSQEINRLLSKRKKRKLSDFFGVLSNEEGAAMLNDLEKIRKANAKMMKKRFK